MTMKKIKEEIFAIYYHVTLEKMWPWKNVKVSLLEFLLEFNNDSTH